MTAHRRLSMMEQQLITLRVRPGETVRFPGLCVACGRPAGEHLTLQKRRGQVTRRIDAPLCAECARRLARRSGEEERLLRLRRLAAVGTIVVLMMLALVVLPLESVWLRLIAGLALGLAGGALAHRALTRRAVAAELPERREVRDAARLVDFTWRDMTLAFARADVADKVRELNAAVVVDEPAAGIELLAPEPAPPGEAMPG